MIQLYHLLLFQPLLNLLTFLYNLTGDIGIAIIIVTILVRLCLLPFSLKATRAQKTLQELQPKLEEIKRKYKDNKEKQTKEMMKFYQEKKVNPFSSCLPMLIQLPIIFALYRVFREGLTAETMQHLYSFVAQPDHINSAFLGLVDMTKPSLVLAIMAGVFQFIQSKMAMGKSKKVKTQGGLLGGMSGMMGKQMAYLMPAMTVFIAISLPSGLALYWITTTLFAIGQQYIIMRKT